MCHASMHVRILDVFITLLCCRSFLCRMFFFKTAGFNPVCLGGLSIELENGNVVTIWFSLLLNLVEMDCSMLLLKIKGQITKGIRLTFWVHEN